MVGKFFSRGIALFSVTVLVSIGLSTELPEPAYAAPCGLGTAYPGSGTSGSPYLIDEAAHLIYLSATSTDWVNKHFRQTGNIDLADCEWTPIGDASTSFSGVFDGQGFEIHGLNVDGGSADYMGFFGVLSNATITGVNLVDGSVTGQDSVGGLAGTAAGTTSISQSSFTGNVDAIGEYVGALVGDPGSGPPPSILYSFAVADVSADNVVGGLVGEYDGGLANSYFRGTVSSVQTATDLYLGGVAGAPWGSVAKSYSTATISVGTGSTGYGLVGRSSASSSTDSFWDTDTSGITDPDQGGIGKSTSQMKTISTFANAGWNIISGWEPFDSSANKVWGICSGVNDGYPFLLWQYTSNPCSSGGSGSASFSSSMESLPGIFLTLGGRPGERVGGSSITFGAYSVAKASPYLLTLQPASKSLGQQILAQGSVNSGGHLERQLNLPTLAEGSYKVVFVGRGSRGELLTLTNLISVDRQGKLLSITPEAMQPRIR